MKERKLNPVDAINVINQKWLCFEASLEMIGDKKKEAILDN